MSAKRDRPPAPIVTKTARGLSPVAAYDAEILWADPPGTEYDLVKRTKRSRPQQSLYWVMLNRVVKATGKWPDADHLHRALKLTLGYVTETVNLRTLEVTLEPDSTALDKMDPDQYREFFDGAVKLLAETLGFDPLAFIEGGRDAA